MDNFIFQKSDFTFLNIIYSLSHLFLSPIPSLSSHPILSPTYSYLFLSPIPSLSSHHTLSLSLSYLLFLNLFISPTFLLSSHSFLSPLVHLSPSKLVEKLLALKQDESLKDHTHNFEFSQHPCWISQIRCQWGKASERKRQSTIWIATCCRRIAGLGWWCLTSKPRWGFD